MVDFLTQLSAGNVVDDERFDRSLLTQSFAINGLSVETDPAGTRRRDFLLSILSVADYDFVEDLASPKDLQQLSYDELVELLDNHYTLDYNCYNKFIDRCDFYLARQRRAESLYQWSARIRNLTAFCNFTNKEETMRDRFISGLIPGVVKNVMLKQDLEKLTLAKTVELAKTVQRLNVESWRRRVNAISTVPWHFDAIDSSNTTTDMEEEISANNHVYYNSVAERTTAELAAHIFGIYGRESASPQISTDDSDSEYEQDIILLEAPPEVIDLTEDEPM